MNKTLYVFLLQDNKYFVYSSDTAEYLDALQSSMRESNMEEIIKLEIVNLFEFVRRHPPVQIVESNYLSDNFEIDKTVKKYMMLYGIDCVRGGSYTSPILPEFQQAALQSELNYLDQPFMALDQQHSMRDEEKMRAFLYQTMLSQELALKTSTWFEKNRARQALLDKYGALCDKRDKLYRTLRDFVYFTAIHENVSAGQFCIEENGKYVMDKSILGPVAKIKEYLNGGFIRVTGDSTAHNTIKKNYRETMNYVVHALYLIKKYRPDEDLSVFFVTGENIHPIYFTHPHFLLDQIVLHPHSSPKDLETAYHLWVGLEGICQWVFNTIDTLTFDVEQLPDNIEWKYEVVRHYAAMLEQSVKMADNCQIPAGIAV